MSPNNLEKISTEIFRIAQTLIDSGIQEDDECIFWRSLSFWNGNMTWTVSENIYSGVSGVGLFFLELYRYSQETKYLIIATKAGNWLLKRQPANKKSFKTNQNFFTGQTGIAFFYTKLYQELNDVKFLNAALNIGETEHF